MTPEQLSGEEDPPGKDRDDPLVAKVNGEAFALHHLSRVDSALVERYVAAAPPGDVADDLETWERLRLHTAVAAFSAAVRSADRERFREALRRNQERGGRDTVRAVRKLLARDDRDTG